jgi:SAM-dependent methyltransferase
MARIAVKDKQLVQQQNISYYDKVADEYNHALNGVASNEAVRQRVREKLQSLLPSGCVLDFGGGTGLDLGWLTASGYSVLFCEPSEAMRAKAIEYNNDTLHSDAIVFLATAQTDYNNWHPAPPLPRQVDAILSNFCPVNNIEDIRLLFSRLALAIKPGGHFVMLLLDIPFKKRFKWHRRNTLLSLLGKRPFVMQVQSGAFTQTAYVHTPADIRKAAAPYFDYRSAESLGGFGFVLVHLTCK